MAKKKKSNSPSSNKMKRREKSRKAVLESNLRYSAARQQQIQDRKDAVEQRLALIKRPEDALAVVGSGEFQPAQMPRHLRNISYCRKSADSNVPKEALPKFDELILYVNKYSDIFDSAEAQKYGKGLVEIFNHRKDWIRPLEGWKPKTHNAHRQFASLVRHLFAKYDVPHFMTSAWYGNNDQHRLWYIHIGSGKNIRTATNLPMPMTKKMAHWFLQAPSDFEIPAAFWWAQVIDMGGNERLVRSLLPTRLASMNSDRDFVLSVLRWFILHPMLDPVHHGPILDYIHNQKYVPSVVNPHYHGQAGAYTGMRTQPRIIPPQPNFSMKGRNPETLLKAVEGWHRQLGRQKTTGPDLFWNPSTIKPFAYEEGEGDSSKFYKTVELLSSRELREEGQAMKHCVASYARSCSQGYDTIWSFQRVDIEGTTRLLTLQVSSSSRTIVQARGKCNAKPTPRDVSILNRWATRGGPKFDKWAL